MLFLVSVPRQHPLIINSDTILVHSFIRSKADCLRGRISTLNFSFHLLVKVCNKDIFY